MHSRGLTLLELLITLSILAILVAIGIPSFTTQIESSRTHTAADELYQAIQLTRSKAISANRRATMRRLASWNAGWEVFFDRDFDGVRDANEELLFSSGALQGASIYANSPLANYVSFIGSGESRFAGTVSSGGFQAGTFTVCPADGGEGYQLVLARSGRVRQSRATAEECRQAAAS
ncbi:GspH/FimT family protein [uncultured Microbulbifer sp.]|uniref:GspH/FimT family pseudopilin n=1 Tax=uncultured Microbulbifer sp. TaxID=348147 RepID=UPI0025FCE5D9|nr:GspH/FimT family protein [uncultured Microbulbifer sp.]